MDEEEDRLNFYSKYNRVKGRQEIDTLYTLIDNNEPAEIQIVNLSLKRQERERRTSQDLKHKSSKPLIPSQVLGKQNEQINDDDDEQINEKLAKLKRLEHQFHEEMDRRQRNLKKKKSKKQQQRRSQLKHKDQLISVEDMKNQNESSVKSSQLKSKKNGSVIKEVIVHTEQLDFQDYYQQIPNVPIYRSQIQNISTKKQGRIKIEQRANRQKQVEPQEQERQNQTESIMIGKMNIGHRYIIDKDTTESQLQAKKYMEVRLTHSQSLNILAQKIFFKKQSQSVENEITIKNKDEMKESVDQDYYHEGNIDQLQGNQYYNTDNLEKQRPQPLLQEKPESEYQNKEVKIQQHQYQKQYKSDKSGESKEELHEDYTSDIINLAYANKNAVIQEGESLGQEIKDNVDPIAHKSEFLKQSLNRSQQTTVVHSPTLYEYRNQKPEEFFQAVSGALDNHITQSPNEIRQSQKLYENKKSSFKKLMADNRANLVPRMAISTILNQHINEVLIDFKPLVHQPVTPLNQSIINMQSSSPIAVPIKKKRVNFKQKIVEQQLNKSQSRELKPAYDRYQPKLQKNRAFLLDFFAQN